MATYEGKRVLVTGGSTGIGLAVARSLTEQGARVVVTGRTRAALDAAQAELGDAGIAIESDASSAADIAALADRAEAALGALDGLFVNAGINGFSSFESTTEELFDQLFAVNAKGPYFTVQRLAPLLVQGSGIVLTTSIANVLGIPSLSAYAAGKAALRSMTRSLARELLPRGIRVNAVSPGAVASGILQKSMPADVAAQTQAEMAAQNPMQRLGSVDEIARAVAFLLFDATYTTGAELPVDGGASQL